MDGGKVTFLHRRSVVTSTTNKNIRTKSRHFGSRGTEPCLKDRTLYPSELVKLQRKWRNVTSPPKVNRRHGEVVRFLSCQSPLKNGWRSPTWFSSRNRSSRDTTRSHHFLHHPRSTSKSIPKRVSIPYSSMKWETSCGDLKDHWRHENQKLTTDD